MRQAKGRVCAHPTSDAGKRLEWPVSKAKNRLHLGEGREVCRYFHHALDAGGGRDDKIATVPSRDRFQARPIWEMSVNIKIFLCDGILEVFRNDQVDLSTRVKDRAASKLAIQIVDSQAVVKQPYLHYFAPPASDAAASRGAGGALLQRIQRPVAAQLQRSVAK